MKPPRTALVTGANRGIGLEVCRQLAALGLRVMLTARDRSKADGAARSLRPGGDVVAARLDVTDPVSIRALASEQIDVLVNNAAVLVDEGEGVLELTAENLRMTFETNVFAPIAVSQAFVPGMISRGYGRIVNVSSQAGQLTSMSTYAPAYSMSKAALNAFTRQLASATRGTGILVNSACPGWVRTDMGGRNAPRSVEQGADTIVWLATLEARGPTGGFFSDRKPIAW
ncbi:MAG TPA: SDR family oxidoreductase [Vicinamibacterales bacterium]|jgi:NAD(P)-dependent dehydrogenase (short-subunit alcohol dehydrogenase family)|nr:SDR family oxidoreductase [Vicinamibacterales bacterium]